MRLFLEELSLTAPVQHEIILKLTALIHEVQPHAEEKMMYGGIMFSLLGEDFAGLFAYQRHVSLEFSKGHSMQDTKQRLAGSGKFRRHLKFHTVADVVVNEPRYYIEQAI